MILPGQIETQLKTVLRHDPDADRIALVWPEPLADNGDNTLLAEIDGRAFTVVYCVSQLAIREQLVLHQPGAARLALLTPFDQSQLAQDILAQVWNQNALRPNPWQTLRDTLGVVSIDPRLSRHKWLAEALVRYHELFHGQVTLGAVLDEDTAWRALASALLGYHDAQVDAQSLLAWSLEPQAAVRFEAAPQALRAHLNDWLQPGLGRLTPVFIQLLEAGHGRDLLAIALAGGVLFHSDQAPSAELFQARGRFAERYLAGLGDAPKLLAQLGADAEALAVRLLQQGRPELQPQLDKAEQILASVDGSAWAELSDLLPLAFEQRLEKLAALLHQALKRGNTDELDDALTRLQQHRLAASKQMRAERMVMAVRLVRWLAAEDNLTGADASETARHYAASGGFVDWARSRIWQGDQNEAVDRAYRAVAEAVLAPRQAANQHFATQLETVAEGLNEQPEALFIESLLDRLVAPLARHKPVLLLVLDGMSLAVYRELSLAIAAAGWVELREQGISGERCLLAMLPTVTSVSRASLLTGECMAGDSAKEKKAFQAQRALRQAVSGTKAPVLYHQGELREAGGGGLAGPVREQLADPQRRVVGLVLNAVDDHLSSGSPVVEAWSIERIALLPQVLEAARDGGRVVIITSDHGHVINHDMELRATSTTGAAGRFKAADEPVADGEIKISGPRVLSPDNTAILPWSERIRYAKGKAFGFHGGASLQEVIVPLGVFISAHEATEIPGWSEAVSFVPGWWQREAPAETKPPAAAKAAQRRSSRKTDSATIDLFEASPADDWITQLFYVPVYQTQRQLASRMPVDQKQLERLLRTLDQRGGQLPFAAVAQQLNLPQLRLQGLLAAIRKVLNVDGYPVLEIDREAKQVKLNVGLLKKQFGL